MLALQVFSKPVDWLGAGASQDEINSLMIADWSSSLPTASFSSDEHGSAVLTFEVQLGPKEARAYYNLCKVAHVLINNGAQIFWTGRIENPSITRTGLYITA